MPPSRGARTVEVAGGARDFELRVYDVTDEDRVDHLSVQLGEVHAGWTPDSDER